MGIVLSSNFVLTEDDPSLTADHPIVLWNNIVTIDNIEADTEDADFPAINLANPATHLKWQAATAVEQYIKITTNSADDLDALAIAKHNLATAGIAASVGYFDTASPPLWTELAGPSLPGDNGPLLFRFTPQPLEAIWLKLAAGSAVAQIAVLSAGKLLVLPRKLYQGITPIVHGRRVVVANGRSEAGDYLGRIVTQEFRESKVPLSLIEPAYYRAHIDAFVAASRDTPFFFGWRPQSYPAEIGYCAMTNEPMPVNESPHGLVALTLEMTGVA